MNINIELYKTFYCVAKNKNISKAADELYVSQPAISKAIKKLEHELDCTLFLRSSRGVVLSKEGEILFKHVEKALTEFALGEELIEKIKTNDYGTVRVGVSNTLCKHYLIPYLEAFHEKYPNIKIVVINNTTNKTLELLNHGKVDFGIVSSPFKYEEYEFDELMKFHDIFVVKQGKYPELLKQPSLQALSDYPLMLLEPDNITRQYIDRFLEENDVYLHPEIEIGSMDFLIEFAKIGLGVASVIQEFVTSELEQGILVEIPVKRKPKSRSIGIVTRKDIPISMASKRFIEFLR